MAAKPLTTEAIAITEKKMDMALGWASEFLASVPLCSCASCELTDYSVSTFFFN